MMPFSFKHNRFLPLIIMHAVWPCAASPFRSAIRRKCWQNVLSMFRRKQSSAGFLSLGPHCRQPSSIRPQPSSRWHLDEIGNKIHGRKPWLWRAVDDEGEVLDFLAQSRCCAKSASRLRRSICYICCMIAMSWAWIQARASTPVRRMKPAPFSKVTLSGGGVPRLAARARERLFIRPHCFRNIGNVACVVIPACTPSTF